MEYDVAIVGIGTAAETAAYLLADAGKKIVVVDSAPYGGTCARYGCQPKKYFVENTHLVAETRALLEKGIAAPAQIDWNALQAFKQTFTDRVPESTESSLSDLGIETLSESIVFIGGGYISMEFATIAAIAGSRVTILQRGDRACTESGSASVGRPGSRFFASRYTDRRTYGNLRQRDLRDRRLPRA